MILFYCLLLCILLEVVTVCEALSKPLVSKALRSSTDPADSATPIGFYVHIPYCRRRCRYCNFSIVPVGMQDQTTTRTTSFDAIHQSYQSDLLAELDFVCKGLRQRSTSTGDAKITRLPLSSIYFGGGTPSLAPVEMIEMVLNRVCLGEESPFELVENAEITMEMDPGTFSKEKLQALKDLGVNRISLGIQSFDDAILESMGRVHREKDIDQAISAIAETFGEVTANYSIDLISGVPGLTLPAWIDTLEKATRLSPRPTHMSVYDLQVEEGTVFGSWYGASHDDEDDGENMNQSKFSKIPRLPNEETVASMYKFCAGYLRAKGYEHYEGALSRLRWYR